MDIMKGFSNICVIQLYSYACYWCDVYQVKRSIRLGRQQCVRVSGVICVLSSYRQINFSISWVVDSPTVRIEDRAPHNDAVTTFGLISQGLTKNKSLSCMWWTNLSRTLPIWAISSKWSRTGLIRAFKLQVTVRIRLFAFVTCANKTLAR